MPKNKQTMVPAKRCGLCDKEETKPSAEKPVIMAAWSPDADKFICGCCNSGIKMLEEIGKKKVKIVDLLSGSDSDEEEDY